MKGLGYNAPGLYQDMVACRSLPNDHRKWFSFLVTSVVVPFAIAIPVVLWSIVQHFTRHVVELENDSDVRHYSFGSRFSFHASRFVSDQTWTGQILKFIGFLCAMGSLFIYFHDTAGPCLDVEMCCPFFDNVCWEIDLAFNCYFFLYYVLRFFAHHNKLAFVFDVYSIVDYFTIPPIFVAMHLDRNWYGLRFLRIVNLLWLVDLLHRFNMIRTIGQVQLARLTCYITMAVICGAGSFLLLECSGDPWDIDNTMQLNGTFWNMAYFSVVTISTVGYGDLGTKTLLGRIFCCLYIFACLFFIASFIAAAASLVPAPRKYPRFDNVDYFNHVVICGHITYDSVSRFLEGFYQYARTDGVDTSYVIILNPTEPEDEMLILLNSYQATVEYVRGSPLEDRDLDRARMRQARACLILANNMVRDVDVDESKHILLVGALKGYCPTLRIQCQVSRPSTVTFLRRHYDMDEERGDVVTCTGDIQTGLMGMSGVVPGFATLVSNLVSTRRVSPEDLRDARRIDVPQLYLDGCEMRLIPIRFSRSFYGMTFPDAAELCYTKLQLLVVSVFTHIQTSSLQDFHDLVPNPPASFVIYDDTYGHVVAPSARHARALEIFCTKCHADAVNPLNIALCMCPNKAVTVDGEVNGGFLASNSKLGESGKSPNQKSKLASQKSYPLPSFIPLRDSATEPFTLTTEKQRRLSASDRRNDETMVDSTGLFHWCPPTDFDDKVMSFEEAGQESWTDHIIIILLSSVDTSIVSPANVLLPMRKSFIPFSELKHVVAVCADPERMRDNWSSICTMPKLTPVVGDPCKPGVLRACHVQHCNFVIIVSAGYYDDEDTDQRLLDKDAVIMTARLRAMQFSQHESVKVPTWFSGREIPVLTMLGTSRSVRYLSMLPGKVDYRLTVPFMSGSVIISDPLEELMIPAYFNPSILRFFSNLVFGGNSKMIENSLAEGIGLSGMQQVSRSLVKGDSEPERHLNTVLRMVEMRDEPLQHLIGQTYGQLFVFALRNFGVLCMGLYRLSHLEARLWGRENRFVATNPPANVLLDESDQVYILFPACLT